MRVNNAGNFNIGLSAMPLMLSLFSSVFFCQCSSDNLAESSTSNTVAEEAQIALEAENWDEAIRLFQQVIDETPAEYQYYPKLGTSYAGRAGIDLVGIVKAEFLNSSGDSGSSSSGSSGSTSILDTVSTYVPAHPTTQQLSDIKSAVTKIKLMPTDHRAKNGPYQYSSEANFTLNLYLSSESAMTLNQYSIATDGTTTEEPTQEQLEQMSDEEVDGIFDNLETIKESGDEDLGPAAEETLEAILATEGDSNKEKLLNYLAANPDSSSSDTTTAFSPRTR